MPRQTEAHIGTLDNTLDVLDAITTAGSAGVTEIADEVDISKSAVYKHLSTLERRGYVVRSSDGYSLGLPWLRYGGLARTRAVPFQRIQTAAVKLADETGELVVFSTLVNGASVPLYQAPGEQAVTTDSHAGVALPLHCTSTGKAMLAKMGDEATELVESVTLSGFTTNTITERESFEEELAVTQDRGFAIDDEERIEGMRGVATAIANESTGDVLGAFGITAPTYRLQGDRFRQQIPQLLRNRAREVEINITYERDQ